MLTEFEDGGEEIERQGSITVEGVDDGKHQSRQPPYIATTERLQI